MGSPFETEVVELHGHPVTYHLMGRGPAVLLVHGITSSSRTWHSVMPALAERHTVIAPDLLGHGRSAKPRGDYSLGAYASGIRLSGMTESSIGRDGSTPSAEGN